MSILGYLIIIGWGLFFISLCINIIFGIVLRKKGQSKIIEMNNKIIKKEKKKNKVKNDLERIVNESSKNDSLNDFADRANELQDYDS